MQVHEITDRQDAYYIISGGFVRISENHITVLAYDVTTFQGKDPAQIESMVSHAQSVVAGQDYIRTHQDAIDQKLAKAIIHMAELASVTVQDAEPQ